MPIMPKFAPTKISRSTVIGIPCTMLLSDEQELLKLQSHTIVINLLSSLYQLTLMLVYHITSVDWLVYILLFSNLILWITSCIIAYLFSLIFAANNTILEGNTLALHAIKIVYVHFSLLCH